MMIDARITFGARRSSRWTQQACAVSLAIVLLPLGPIDSLLAADDDNDAESDSLLVIVVGAAGNEEYGNQFDQWADRWEAAARQGNVECVRIGGDDQEPSKDSERLRGLIEQRAIPAETPLWIVLIGHGTFDGRQAKFNLRGPDISATELANWLKPLTRPVAIVNCASASGPFVNRLSRPDRVVMTATKSGQEHFFARFGQYLSEAINDPSADLDKDDQVSLLEAFIAGSRRTDQFYEREARLATEHALVDDNGDGLGTRASWYRGVRAVRSPKDGAELDGLRAHQLHLVPSDRERNMPAEKIAKRNQIELAIEDLRKKKAQLSEDQYYQQLEALLLPLARLYEEDGEDNPSD